MPKPRPRYLLYLTGALIYMLVYNSPLCYRQWEGIVFALLPLFFVLLVLEVSLLIGKSYRIVSYLNKGDAQKFLDETRKELAYAPRGQWRYYYLINSTAGLYYLGRFDEALKILAEIPAEKLRHRMYRILYYNNTLANLLGAERIEEASALVRDHAAVFAPGRFNHRFYFALQANIGVLKYFLGEREVARYLLEESLKRHRSQLGAAVAHYYLGRIFRDEGKEEAARSHFDQVRELGAGSFVARRLSDPL